MDIAKCVFIITAYNIKEDVENIIFINVKEIFEIPPTVTTFYDDYGKDGIGKYLFKVDDIRFKQWFCILSDDDSKNISSNIIQQGIITFKEINKTFILDQNINLVNDKSFNAISDYPICSYYNTKKYIYKNSKYLKDIHFNSIKGDFTDNLITFRDDIPKDFFPYDYIRKSALSAYINKNIIFIDSKIFFIHDFRGINPENKSEDPKEFIGVVIFSPIERAKILVSIFTEDEEITWEKEKVNIDVDTGRWVYKSIDQIGKGKIVYFNKKSKTIIAAEKFTLIKNCSVNVNSVTEIAKDLYGESIMQGDNVLDIKNIDFPGNKCWYRESFSGLSDIDFEKKVSAYLTEVLIYNESKIVFYDPYCLGEIILENGLPKINSSLRVFINALIHAMNKVKITEIDFCCRKKIVSKFWESTDKLPIGYKLLLDQLKQLNKGIVFRFRFYDGTFHNRHIVNFEKEQTINISHSLNGLISSDELEVRELSSDESQKVNARIMRIWDKSKKSEIVYD